jgi:hypothetical protein
MVTQYRREGELGVQVVNGMRWRQDDGSEGCEVEVEGQRQRSAVNA